MHAGVPKVNGRYGHPWNGIVSPPPGLQLEVVLC
jgi:hypothetical protein